MSFAVRARWSLVPVALALVAVGCGAPGPGELTGENASAVTFANDKAAFDYFLGKGLTNFQAAGIVGNLDQESGVDPMSMQSGGPGRGIAQWSVGGRWDTDSNDNASWYASQQGEALLSLQLQLDFIWYELTTFSGYGLATLKASTNVTDATVAFQNDFEGCGTCVQSQRIAYAQNVLNTYGNDMVDGGGGTAPDAGGIPCTVPGVGDGVCILTTDCAAMPGHVSTPNYCPGAADIQCCTGPADDGGSTTHTDGGDGGANPPADSGGGGDASEPDGASSSGGGSGASPDSGEPRFSTSASKGCSTSASAASGPAGGLAGPAVAGFALLLARRRRPTCRR